MTKSGYTHLVLLVDRSGSMRPIAEDMQGGIAQLLADQAAAPGTVTVSLYQFDHEFECVHGPYPIAEVPPFELVPRGSTALLDALGRSITETGEILAGLQEHHRPEKVIFAVITDGAENRSQEWSRDQVASLINQQTEAYGWEFLFLSADLAAIGEARSLGFGRTEHFEHTSAGTRVGTQSLSRSVTRSRSGA